MELTIQEAHTYIKLMNDGLAQKNIFHGFDEYPLIVTGLDSDDRVYFKDIASGTTCYPGLNIINSIRLSIDKYLASRLP
jgi:hypothetical protein